MQANITPTCRVERTRRTTQPICETVRVRMKILQTSRRSGSCRAARIHCAIIGTRMIT